MMRTATTNAPSAPKIPLPSKQRWKCIIIRPQSGRPLDADGQLILTYVWEAAGKDQPAPPPPPKQKAIRGVRADLFDA